MGDRLIWKSPHSADCTQWVFIRHRVCARCSPCSIWWFGPYGIPRWWTQKRWQPSQSCMNSHACYGKRLSIHICWMKNNKCCRLVFIPVVTDNKTEFQGILSRLLIIACQQWQMEDSMQLLTPRLEQFHCTVVHVYDTPPVKCLRHISHWISF